MSWFRDNQRRGSRLQPDNLIITKIKNGARASLNIVSYRIKAHESWSLLLPYLLTFALTAASMAPQATIPRPIRNIFGESNAWPPHFGSEDTRRKPGLICCRCTSLSQNRGVWLMSKTLAVTIEMQSAKVVVWPFWLLWPPGIKLEDRVGTLMWNSAWHMECLWAKIVQVLACFARHMFSKVWV